MAFLKFEDVAIKGIAACTPKNQEENSTLGLFSSNEEAQKFIESTGVERRRVANMYTTTADLCFQASEKLILDLKWSKESIECIVFVTQTPDYILPATSCILQKRLGLSEECFALDISLGCSGWVYGLSVISGLLSKGNIKRGLLLAGDTALRPCSNEDKSTWPLFGDAGTATAVVYEPDSRGFKFHFGTDGGGYDAIIIPDGGYRNVSNESSFKIVEIGSGIRRNRLQTALNGMDVFAFGISKAPETIIKLLHNYSLNPENIDFFIFHQANKFMNEKIRKKLKLPEEKVPYSLRDFGNTSSATIPLTMVTQLKEQLFQDKILRQIGCGFGVGLSWGSVYFETKNLVISDLIEI